MIFGGTGDLTRRKLMPALFQLGCKSRLPEGLSIVAFARPEMTNDAYRDLMWDSVREFGDLAVRRDEWRMFEQRLSYVSGDLTRLDDFVSLKRDLLDFEEDFRPPNCLFYLSIAPQFFESTIHNLGASGIATEEGGWRRVVIEKPYGRDLDSAKRLNLTVGDVFREDQVYRIDHYLGKETVQNLLVFRFANGIFQPLWSRDHIDSVQITVSESVSVGDRAGYYDQSGVVRDMVQNHLLQLLTMVAMDPPGDLGAESVRGKKAEVLKAIRTGTDEKALENTVLGQYRGYLEENGVAPGSRTPTYAALRLYIDNWRWQGVPFYLPTGKSMAVKATEILIRFRRPAHMLFESTPDSQVSPNILSLCLQPDEGVHLKFDVKVPDKGLMLRSQDMEFHYESAFKDQAIPEAYELLIRDALQGDASLFIRSDHIEEAWRIVDPLLQAWDATSNPDLRIYEPGSWGPKEADSLLADNGHIWQLACGQHGAAD
ncbi:MAG: glucose-6-phosphate dehydrogenase [Chloroflexi bacterium]|nr:glucose-6-phosphate dehydrogenase [Chloroflexota bacterium]